MPAECVKKKIEKKKKSLEENNSLERTKSYKEALEGETIIDNEIIEVSESPKDNIKTLQKHIKNIRNVERASKTESLHGKASNIDPEIEEL